MQLEVGHKCVSDGSSISSRGHPNLFRHGQGSVQLVPTLHGSPVASQCCQRVVAAVDTVAVLVTVEVVVVDGAGDVGVGSGGRWWWRW